MPEPDIQPDPQLDPELTPDAPPPAGGEPPAPAPPGEPAPAGFKWGGFGLERYDTMKQEDIARDVQYRNGLYGRQSNELGEYRRKVAEYEAQLAKFKEVATGKAVQPTVQSRQMTEQEVERWLQDFTTNPHKAMEAILGENFGRAKDDDLKKMIADEINSALGGYHGYVEEQSIQGEPDYHDFSGYIQILRGPEHFGQERSPRECLEFARVMAKNKLVGDRVYEYARQYKELPIKECVRLAEVDMPPANASEVAATVKKAATIPASAGGARRSQQETITSMDDAFAL